MKFSNIKKPTSAKLVQVGAGFTVLGSSIATYGFSANFVWMQIAGFVCVVLGVLIPLFGSDDSK